MAKPIIFECGICKSWFKSLESAGKCESQGPSPIKIPLGSLLRIPHRKEKEFVFVEEFRGITRESHFNRYSISFPTPGFTGSQSSPHDYLLGNQEGFRLYENGEQTSEVFLLEPKELSELKSRFPHLREKIKYYAKDNPPPENEVILGIDRLFIISESRSYWCNRNRLSHLSHVCFDSRSCPNILELPVYK